MAVSARPTTSPISTPRTWKPTAAIRGTKTAWAGCGGLAESGYLPLLLPTLDAEHLDRAGVLISIAPGREFSPAERKVVGDFVGKGGLLLSMVGAEDAGPSRELLADFGLGVPPMPLPPAENTRETVPLGATAQVFASDGDRAAWVQFHAAWPIQRPEDAEVLCTASDGQYEYPVVVGRKIGSGAVVLIGDSCFAMNKNFAPRRPSIRKTPPSGGGCC